MEDLYIDFENGPKTFKKITLDEIKIKFPDLFEALETCGVTNSEEMRQLLQQELYSFKT